MAFFNGEKYEKTQPRKIHKQRSLELRKISVSLGFHQRWTTKRWAEDFRKLHDVDEIPAGEIQGVIEWYEQEAYKIPEPQIINARHFRNAWNWLQKIKKKGEKSRIEISPKAQGIFNAVKYLGWPKGSKDNLPAAIQLTLDEFIKFREKVELYANNNPAWVKLSKGRKRIATKEVRFAHYLIKGNAMPGSDTLTQLWFVRLHDQVKNWNQWSGNILGMVWDGNLWHKEFRKIAKGWAASYSIDGKLWENFCDVIK